MNAKLKHIGTAVFILSLLFEGAVSERRWTLGYGGLTGIVFANIILPLMGGVGTGLWMMGRLDWAEGEDCVVSRAMSVSWAPNFDDYASGKIDADQIQCALCDHAPCDCPEFGSDEYMALIEARHGRSKKVS